MQGRDTINRNKGWTNYEYSFTGSDYRITYVSHAQQGLKRVLDSLQTITFSTHSEIYPARRLGEKGAHGHARGVRTVAGTLIFLFRGNDPFLQEIAVSKEIIRANGAYETRRCHIEMIPEFDLVIEAIAEVPLINPQTGEVLRQDTKMFVGGITLAESGGTISTHDVYTEIQYTYMARYLIPFASSVPLEDIRALTQPQTPVPSISSLWNQYQEDLEQFQVKRGKIKR